MKKRYREAAELYNDGFHDAALFILNDLSDSGHGTATYALHLHFASLCDDKNSAAALARGVELGNTRCVVQQALHLATSNVNDAWAILEPKASGRRGCLAAGTLQCMMGDEVAAVKYFARGWLVFDLQECAACVCNVLVTCQGRIRYGLLEEKTSDAFRSLWNRNLSVWYACAEAFCDHLLPGGLERHCGSYMRELYATCNQRARDATLAWMASRLIRNPDVMRCIGQLVWKSRANAQLWIH